MWYEQENNARSPESFKSVIARKAIPVYGDGMNVRDWLYVRDHAEALWTVLGKGALDPLLPGSDGSWIVRPGYEAVYSDRFGFGGGEMPFLET